MLASVNTVPDHDRRLRHETGNRHAPSLGFGSIGTSLIGMPVCTSSSTRVRPSYGLPEYRPSAHDHQPALVRKYQAAPKAGASCLCQYARLPAREVHTACSCLWGVDGKCATFSQPDERL